MIYDYLLEDSKQPPSHPIWIEHLTKKVISAIFRFATSPPPYGGNGGSLLTRGCNLQKYFWFRLWYCSTTFFHNILQGISIIYTNNKLHIYSKCKNFRQALLQRAGVTDGLFLCFQARALQYIFLIDRFISLLFYPFCNNKINFINKNKIRIFYIPIVKYARNVTLFHKDVSIVVCVTYDVDIDNSSAWAHSFTKWNIFGLKLIRKRCTLIKSLLFFKPFSVFECWKR